MRQVTGSNLTPSNKKVSIQLKLDGHSFSRDILPRKIAEGANVEVELLTAKSIAVPAECFDPELAENLLAMSGIALSEDEQAVWSGEQEGIVAVMALPRDYAEGLQSHYGDRLQYSSPLLRKISGKGRYLYIYNMGKLAYFKLYNESQIEYCQAHSLTGGDDLLYIIERLAQEFSLRDFVVGLAGDCNTALLKVLKQYHKVEKCE